MHSKSIDLTWICVKDLKKAIQFYTEILGFNLEQLEEKHNWAEVRAPEGGAVLGLAQMGPESELKPGGNAIPTITVDDIVSARSNLEKAGVDLQGEIIEVPGHVKMQLFTDVDGNHFQLVENL